MATAQGQDVIRCKLCPEPVEFHCNLCNIELCSSCVLRHMMDKSTNHEVVSFESIKDKMEYPVCHSHNIKCETYCRDCKASICIKCIIGLHKEHDFTEMDDIVQIQRKRIEIETQDLEENVLKRLTGMKEIVSSSNTVIDNVLDELSRRENQIQTAVHKMAEKMKKEVVLMKKRNTDVVSENQSKISVEETKLKQAIKNNRHILRSRRVQDILNYESINENFKTDLSLEKCVSPRFVYSEIQNDQIMRLLGNLSCKEERVVKQHLHLKETPEILHSCIIQGSNKSVWRVLCVGNNQVWVSGERNSVKQIDRYGASLQVINTAKTPVAFSFDNWKCLRYLVNDDPKVYISKDNKVDIYLDCDGWLPRGLCHLRNGNILVSMRSNDEKQSRVVRFSGTTEILKIQYGTLGKPLFSVDVSYVLLLTENGNGDICVADYGGNAVVVLDYLGELRFKYDGNLAKYAKYTQFLPMHIATDVNHQLLIGDSRYNIVHIIDCDGNFVRYIEHTCNGGLSIDTDNNLVIADRKNGKIQFLKYLEGFPCAD